MAVVIRAAVSGDTQAWMDLLEQVRGNFPGLETQAALEDYRQTLQRNILRGSALCAWEDGVLAGALLYSPKHHLLSWMAVHPKARRKGIAGALVREMLRHMDPECEVRVSTFRREDPMGAAPRALYEKMGFIPGELTEEFGYPTQVFVLGPRDTGTLSV